MAKTKLVIVESPTKAKKIQSFLGKDYTVLASVGHIRDLAQPSQIPASKKKEFGRFGVDVNDKFKPYYIIDPGHRKTVTELKKALANASELYLATDEDREGEAISWHLVQTLKPKVPVRRMVFHEITKPAILDSLNHTRDVDENMVSAQETRRVLDRLYGYELSPVLWRKVGPHLSAGRVQSVATRLIVERERERMAFVPAVYRDLLAHLSPTGSGADAFDARLISLDDRRLAVSKDFDDKGELTARAAKENPVRLSQEQATALADDLTGKQFTVSEVSSRPYSRRPAPPFTTSTLQQAAGNQLGMSSRQTMRAAQSLYENGLITYMRTDAVTLSQQAIHAAREQVSSLFGKDYLSAASRQFRTTTAGAQEAHEAIRPAGDVFRSPDEIAARVPADQLRLYTLIWQRTLATQMADEKGRTDTIRLDIETNQQGTARFQASGTVITFPGYMRAYGQTTEKLNQRSSGATGQANLPDLSHGDSVTPVGVTKTVRDEKTREEKTIALEPVEVDDHSTQPPARYTEASLVKTLEAREIGRPSTYASIISTILSRGYVYEKGRAMIPSWLAFSVIKLLEHHFPQYVDYEFTAHMENGLDQIAQGKETSLEWLTRFYFGTAADSVKDERDATEGLHQQVSELGDIDAHDINTIAIGEGINVRVGRFGPYLEDTKHLDKEGTPRHASIPDDLAPDELTVEKARELFDSNSGGARVLGTDAAGNTIEVRSGHFGPYIAQIAPEESEEAGTTASADSSASTKSTKSTKTAKSAKSAKSSKTAKSAPKPKMVSLFKTMTPETVTLEQAEKLLSMPRTVGEENGSIITATNGRYGPYLTRTDADGKKDTRSLQSEEEIFTITFDQAKDLFAQPKYRGRGARTAKPPLRELGTDPESGKPVVIKSGFYGDYITDGTTNRTLPKQFTPESISPEEAFQLLAEKRAQGPRKRTTRRTRKTTSTAKKSTTRTKRTASTTRKTSTTRKSAAAKKTTAKSSTAKSSTTKRSTSTRKTASSRAKKSA